MKIWNDEIKLHEDFERGKLNFAVFEENNEVFGPKSKHELPTWSELVTGKE